MYKLMNENLTQRNQMRKLMLIKFDHLNSFFFLKILESILVYIT